MANPVKQRFASETGMKMGQVNHLLRLVDAAVAAQTEEANTPGAPLADPKIQRVEDYVKRLGHRVDWPGLYPVIINSEGRRIHLPD